MTRVPDKSEIVPNLWQGSKSATWKGLSKFDVLVLCAEEWQPPKTVYPPSLKVIYAPNSDDPFRVPTREELLIATKAAREVAEANLRGKRVLVTCMAGLNRSGLVTALALHFLTGADGLTCMNVVHRNRRRSLRNPMFQLVLSRVPKQIRLPKRPMILTSVY